MEHIYGVFKKSNVGGGGYPDSANTRKGAPKFCQSLEGGTKISPAKIKKPPPQ